MRCSQEPPYKLWVTEGGQRRALGSAGWVCGLIPLRPAEDKDGGRSVALSTVKKHSGSAEKPL